MQANNLSYTPLREFVSDRSPICYGILKPGKGEPNGVPVIKVKDISGGGVATEGLLLTSKEIDEQYRRSRLKEGDILLTIRGTTGRVAIVPSQLSGANITQDTARIRVNDKCNPHYLFYALQSPFTQQQINLNTVGQAVKGINIAEVKKLKIYHPDENTQFKIAQILSTWDQAIETTERLIENSKAQKKALMQQLLTGKNRLPGSSGEWQEYRFKQIFDRLKRRNTVGNENVLTISGKDGLVSQKEYFNKRVASENLEGYTLLHRGDFAYNKSYSNGYPYGAVKPLDRYDAGVVSSLYICFHLINAEDHNHDFLRHYFEGGYFDREIYAIAQEGARNHGLLNVSSTDFFNTRLLLPALDEQTAIAAVVNTAEAEQTNLELQLDSFRLQKKALMQQLLTGKRRVKVDT